LKILEVDPAMLVGRGRCERVKDPERLPPCLPVSDFARLLPASLEELTFGLDWEQIERLLDYATALIDSLISENRRLTYLRRVYWMVDRLLSSNR
jgi:hypothetical protein